MPSLSEIGDLSCITSCLVLSGFLEDTLLIFSKILLSVVWSFGIVRNFTFFPYFTQDTGSEISLVVFKLSCMRSVWPLFVSCARTNHTLVFLTPTRSAIYFWSVIASSFWISDTSHFAFLVWEEGKMKSHYPAKTAVLRSWLEWRFAKRRSGRERRRTAVFAG